MTFFIKISFTIGLLLLPFLGDGTANPITIKPDYADIQGAKGTRDIVQEIINVIGLKPRFELMAADIDNAAAVIYNGKRYILYNPNFLTAINNAVHTDWGGVSIIAHEIGHHLNGHTLSRNGSNPTDELEADEFSGFVLRKMGASLKEAQAAINLISDNRSTRSHPGRNYRLEAISKGWNSANEQLHASARLPQPSQKGLSIPPKNQNEAFSYNSPSNRPIFDKSMVLNRVYINNYPHEEYYITTKLLFVHISDKGIRILGKLAKTNNPGYPFYLRSDQIEPLFISERGKLVDKNGNQIGYLT